MVTMKNNYRLLWINKKEGFGSLFYWKKDYLKIDSPLRKEIFNMETVKLGIFVFISNKHRVK